jgi:hypothetical protein
LFQLRVRVVAEYHDAYLFRRKIVKGFEDVSACRRAVVRLLRPDFFIRTQRGFGIYRGKVQLDVCEMRSPRLGQAVTPVSQFRSKS